MQHNELTRSHYFSNNSFSAGATSAHRPAKDGRTVPRATNDSLSSPGALGVGVGSSLVAHTAKPNDFTSVMKTHNSNDRINNVN